MIFYPNCKINIGLRVLSKRADGFHDIESIFYPVKWCDILEVMPLTSAPDGQINFETSGIQIPGHAVDNLCVKAYELIKHDYLLPALSVHLHKIIPLGAGLGGGSADAAFFIKAINDITEINLSFGEMHHYAKILGSDCSFFINSKPALALQKGDDLEPVAIDLTAYYICIVYPAINMNTKEAYARIKPSNDGPSLEELILEPMATWKNTIKNDFETALGDNASLINEIKNKLYTNGAIYASMTGSGSAVYGIFAAQTNLKNEFDGLLIFEGKLD
jgi:4-diphosphocytidyl-2-C-methyl-D-erythritol kinase